MDTLEEAKEQNEEKQESKVETESGLDQGHDPKSNVVDVPTTKRNRNGDYHHVPIDSDTNTPNTTNEINRQQSDEIHANPVNSSQIARERECRSAKSMISANTPNNPSVSKPKGKQSGSQVINILQHETEIKSETEILHRLVQMVLILCAAVVAIYRLADAESAQYKIIAVMVAVLSSSYFVYWLYLIARSSQLHLIRLVTARIEPYYGDMIFPMQIKHYPSRPIKAMSEMLAIRGSSAHIAQVSVGTVVATLNATAVTLKWLERHQSAQLNDQSVDINYVEEMCVVATILAMPLIGLFEYNVHSMGHLAMHSLGFFCLALSVWPFAIQSQWSLMSIVLIVLTYSSFVFWVILAFYVYPHDLSTNSKGTAKEQEMREDHKQMIRKVHRISVHCLYQQTLGAIGCTASFVCYLWNL